MLPLPRRATRGVQRRGRSVAAAAAGGANGGGPEAQRCAGRRRPRLRRGRRGNGVERGVQGRRPRAVALVDFLVQHCQHTLPGQGRREVRNADGGTSDQQQQRCKQAVEAGAALVRGHAGAGVLQGTDGLPHLLKSGPHGAMHVCSNKVVLEVLGMAAIGIGLESIRVALRHECPVCLPGRAQVVQRRSEGQKLHLLHVCRLLDRAELDKQLQSCNADGMEVQAVLVLVTSSFTPFRKHSRGVQLENEPGGQRPVAQIAGRAPLAPFACVPTCSVNGSAEIDQAKG
mmetsp:Transcript_86912/g.245123  ORF Transcript_86912/g.245123 Transcript_86912/m.245123 type:complete len:286 (+) Transcript_86912:22-879(+)